METSSDTYLHKKFKKQLTVEPKSLLVVHHEKENKDTARVVGTGEEKNTLKSLTNPDNCLNQNIADNNQATVPNQSTNHENVLNAVNLSTSSISTKPSSGNTPYLYSSISSNQVYEENHKSLSFDKALFRYSPINRSHNSLSSVPENLVYNGRNLSESTESYRRDDESYRHNSESTESYRRESESYDQDLDDQPEDYSNRDDFEAKQPLPDKNSNGKYVCSYCSLVCSKPSVLQKHIRAHTNERPYPCTSCGFSFKTRSNLYKHCRSRAHANRVMGNKSQTETESDSNKQSFSENYQSDEYPEGSTNDLNKPYKPRFHTPIHLRENVPIDSMEEDDRIQVNHSDLTHHINEIIIKNNSIVNSSDSHLLKKRMTDIGLDYSNNNSARMVRIEVPHSPSPKPDEPLNLSNKNRKRSMSEAIEPLIQKSLIKELLLKNLSASDMQCPHCKMIFQTVTELDIHQLRTCKGKSSEAKCTRSSSVNVASILTKDRHAFDNIPQLQNTISFPLNSPGPFLGNTRLVEGDKTKSFSFDTGNLPLLSPVSEKSASNYLLSPLPFEKERKHAVRLFGGEVKVHNSSGETKSFRIDNQEDKFEPASNFVEFGPKISESRVVKSSFQSGGTVLTNKSNYKNENDRTPQDVMRIYENKINSPSLFSVGRFNFDRQNSESKLGEFTSTPENVSSPFSYMDMANFSQNAVKMLTPNIKQPFILNVPANLGASTSLPMNSSSKSKLDSPRSPRVKERPEMAAIPDTRQTILHPPEIETKHLSNSERRKVLVSRSSVESPSVAPKNLFVNGKIVRHVPGMPGPVLVEESQPDLPSPGIITVSKNITKELKSPVPLRSPLPSEGVFLSPRLSLNSPLSATQKVVDWMQKSPKPISLEEKPKTISTELRPPIKIPEPRSPTKELSSRSSESNEPKKFVRPNSLALKPTPAFSKQQHGLTPTIFNQILISPDTPRVAKKYAQHFLHGNYFSYLGLKSSTKLVYCTLNKTQPFYVPHFKRLSMYSEWRQQDNRIDKSFASQFDARQRRARYSIAGKATADLIIHSSYKFVVTELPTNRSEKDDDSQKQSLVGGYECTEEYSYIRGRGRGKYVCQQCGIRCKKPSMLKKHIRTHSDDRPYTCSQCNFSFKTKGNLTKHMKSKSHTKNISTSSGEPSLSAQLSGGTPSSDSEDDDSGMDSSDESVTRKEEHEAAYGLLSLSQKPTSTGEVLTPASIIRSSSPTSDILSTEEVAHVSKRNYAKNKILDDRSLSINFGSIPENTVVISTADGNRNSELANYLGKTSTSRPLTYPYTTVLVNRITDKLLSPVNSEGSSVPPKAPIVKNLVPTKPQKLESDQEAKNIKSFHVIQKYASTPDPPKIIIENNTLLRKSEDRQSEAQENNYKIRPAPVPLLKVNDVVMSESVDRKRKLQPPTEIPNEPKIQKNDVMDLSVTSHNRVNGVINKNMIIETSNRATDQFKAGTTGYLSVKNFLRQNKDADEEMPQKNNQRNQENGPVLLLKPVSPKTPHEAEVYNNNCNDYDNSAMETLADVATKQVKLEKNTLAKSVASEYLKLATQNENLDGMVVAKDVNDLMVKSEGSKSCSICAKSFSKPSQLRLHMNIHYLERPFRCDSCSVSFRTKGHLQKHERSASHYSKLSTSPAQSSSEPRPFKCQDCHIAFRIHGHLAKHLRSKLHIMKLECLSKIPFGLYAELERSNSLLTEINTSDADQCLESLKTLAAKVFLNDKLQTLPNHSDMRKNVDSDS